MLKRTFQVIALSMLGMLWPSGHAHACSCFPPPPPSQAFFEADAVLLAKVISFEQVDSLFHRVARLSIERIWKGDEEKARDIYTAASSASCGYDFQIGEDYLIYAFEYDDGKLHTHLCTRTALVEAAGEDLRFLEAAAYFPLAIGNQWSFVNGPTETITDTLTIDSHVYFRFDRFREFENSLLRMNDAGQLIVRSDSMEQVWLDFGAEVGDSWPVRGPDDLNTWTVHLQSQSDTVRVPAGTFFPCYRFHFQFAGADNDWVEWYAPDVGPVKRDLLGFAYIEYPLENAIINGRSVKTSVTAPETGGSIRTFELAQNFPNPFSLREGKNFNRSTMIHFSLEKAAFVTLSIHNLLGQETKTLLRSYRPAGTHAVVWDGTDSDGREVSPGVYLYRLRVGERNEVRKIVVTR